MGAVAAFCGFIYNECFSLSVSWVRSGWSFPEDQLPTKNFTYILGVDPVCSFMLDFEIFV
jgi:hypothetical protein